VDAVAADAVAAAPARTARAVVLLAWSTALLGLVLLDVTFNQWFWRIPKLTPVSADYGYQFLVDARALAAAAKTPGVPRVLAIGSSVAGAFDPGQVERVLRAGGTAADVHRLLLPGIKPSDLRLFFATDGATLDPDVVVVLLNPLDFLNPSFERDLKPQVRAVLPPGETLRQRGAFISTVAGKLDLAAAAVSNLYRYRTALRACLEDHLRWAWRWLRGTSTTGGFGWYADGFTRQRFAVPVAPGSDGFDFYVDPAWISQQGSVTLALSGGGGAPLQHTVTTPGWQHVTLPPGVAAGDLLYVSADSAWSPRAAGRGEDVRLLGVQLRAVPPVPPAGAAGPLHYPPDGRRAPDPLLRMRGEQGDAFVARWQALLEADTEFGRRFRAYRDSKLAARETPVQGGGEYAELDRLVRGFTAQGARVVLINNPESELLRAQYVDSPYYRSYLEFLEGIAQRHPHTTVHDLGAALPIDQFNDWHHVNYIGAARLGPTYAALVRDALTAPPAR
jgi:hypothetical protein